MTVQTRSINHYFSRLRLLSNWSIYTIPINTLRFQLNSYQMKMVYIAEKEELQELIRESIRQEIETFLKGINQKTIPERLSLVEAAQYLGVSKSTMYRFTHTKKIPYYKFGRSVFFYTKEIDDYLREYSIRHKSHNEIEREAIEYLSKAAQRRIGRLR